MAVQTLDESAHGPSHFRCDPFGRPQLKRNLYPSSRFGAKDTLDVRSDGVGTCHLVFLNRAVGYRRVRVDDARRAAHAPAACAFRFRRRHNDGQGDGVRRWRAEGGRGPGDP